LGEFKSNTEYLEQAVDAFRIALSERPREIAPLEWATTQNNLGAALQALGECNSDTKLMEQAVDAYRAALEEWTDSRTPSDWAGVQINLGNALAAICERTGSLDGLGLEETAANLREAIIISPASRNSCRTKSTPRSAAPRRGPKSINASVRICWRPNFFRTPYEKF
jgi:tetratricopeptide (TPR) repeat protein